MEPDMRIFTFAAGVVVWALVGCGSPSAGEKTLQPAGLASAETGRSSAVEKVTAPQTSSLPNLTSDGWGPIQVGMSRAELEAVAGALPPLGDPRDRDDCEIVHPAGVPTGLSVMLWSGRVASVWVETDAIRTADGLGAGATAKEIRARYGARVTQRGHEYIESPAEYLDIVTTRVGDAGDGGIDGYAEVRGISFHIGEDGLAYQVAGGDGSIRSVEGCA